MLSNLFLSLTSNDKFRFPFHKQKPFSNNITRSQEINQHLSCSLLFPILFQRFKTTQTPAAFSSKICTGRAIYLASHQDEVWHTVVLTWGNTQESKPPLSRFKKLLGFRRYSSWLAPQALSKKTQSLPTLRQSRRCCPGRKKVISTEITGNAHEKNSIQKVFKK